MPVVLNKEQSDWRELENAALVDRTTVYGNPFIEGIDGDRDAVCDFYFVWIMKTEQRQLRRRMRRELAGLNLVCHCTPLRCHADTILIIANGIKYPYGLSRSL